MEFWVVFFSFTLVVYIISLLLKDSYHRYISYIYVFFVWMIGAFRKDIGTDYSTYEAMYNIWPMYIHDSFLDERIEPTFSFIVTVLHTFDFHSQMLFVVYETLIILFLYLGAKLYLKNSFCVLIFMLLYVIFPTNGGYWWDLNGMRQAAAISIAFYSSSFFIARKYLCFVFLFALACVFHYSAIIFIVVFVIQKKLPLKLVSVLLFIGFIFNATGINARLIMECASVVSSIVGMYEYASLIAIGGTASFSITAFYFSLLYLVAVSYLKQKNISLIIMNGASFYIILRVYMSFGVEDSVLAAVVHRFETYFMPFFLLLIVMAMIRFIKECKTRWQAILVTSMVFISFIILALNTVYVQQNDAMASMAEGASAGNVEYRMSFDLF